MKKNTLEKLSTETFGHTSAGSQTHAEQIMMGMFYGEMQHLQFQMKKPISLKVSTPLK